MKMTHQIFNAKAYLAGSLLHFICLSYCSALNDTLTAQIEGIIDKKLEDSELIGRSVEKYLQSEQGKDFLKQEILSNDTRALIMQQLDSQFVRKEVLAYLKSTNYRQAFNDNTGYKFETVLAIMAVALVLPSILVNICLILFFKFIICMCCRKEPRATTPLPLPPTGENTAQKEIISKSPNNNTLQEYNA